MPEDNTETIKRLFDEALLQWVPSPPFPSSRSPHHMFSDVSRQCESQGATYDHPAAMEYWGHLARVGVIALAGYSLSSLGDSFILTQRGRKLLERGEKSPHDPPRYMKAVRDRVGKPDETALTYLDEAVGAWAAGLYRASAVMLGCACERLVLVLGVAIVSAKLEPWAGRIEKQQKQGTGISRVFDTIRGCLTQLRDDKKLPGNLADALDRRLSSVFDYARGLRNQSGHPTGADVSAGAAEAGLLLFPDFHALVNDLCEQLSTTG